MGTVHTGRYAPGNIMTKKFLVLCIECYWKVKAQMKCEAEFCLNSYWKSLGLLGENISSVVTN